MMRIGVAARLVGPVETVKQARLVLHGNRVAQVDDRQAQRTIGILLDFDANCAVSRGMA